MVKVERGWRRAGRMLGIAEPTWSYRQAERILGVPRRTIAKTARRLGVNRPGGRPLDGPGIARLAAHYGVKVRFKCPA